MPWRPRDPLRVAREQHRRKQVDAARPKDRLRPYNRAAWRKVRAVVLSRSPACVECGQRATEVDHINGDPWDNRPDNLRGMCKPCHSRRTARDQVHGGRP
jgi:5-methylcytosine-specific restriction endonuclease McrA